MYDLLLDVRRDSPTFGESMSVPIEADRTWVWVPPNVAHGNYFPVETVIEYLCTAEYNKAGEHGINPLSVFDLSGCIISDKDMAAPTFEQWKAQQ
jgi:dTDP-4-dehydrorhamnose 3,5-epimerase